MIKALANFYTSLHLFPSFFLYHWVGARVFVFSLELHTQQGYLPRGMEGECSDSKTTTSAHCPFPLAPYATIQYLKRKRLIAGVILTESECNRGMNCLAPHQS